MNQKPKVYPSRLYMRFIVFVFLTIFSWIYRIHKNMPLEVRELKAPYLVLGNHVGFWDPFVSGNFLPKFTRYVASDVPFKKPITRFFLSSLGTIPKKKNIRDTKVIRDIISVIRQGNNVGIYPEAVRNWAGSSFPIDRSIVKLIRLLKVPVVVPILKGMNLFNPRWSVKMRPSRVLIDYRLLFTASQVKELPEDELFEKLVKAISHDEVDFQRKAMIPIRSKIKAEHISHALYVCPECEAIDSFRCSGNDFHCIDCGYDIHINRFGFFERASKGVLHYDNIRDWYNWEEEFLYSLVREKIKQGYSKAIFTDYGSHVYHCQEGEGLKSRGIADVSLYTDRILISYKDKSEEILNFNDLQTINPQLAERLEMAYKDEDYSISGCRPGVSALKWEVAVNAIWKDLGLDTKLSAYIKC